ncbi:MAG: pantoate--beta-alanine ligase [Dysgonamonadaceae bacterium]|jgi:pantoate--beta-alanine ligase|nr:pantoate--beta-alanine ligase [Dysgonamonadaceae bacterium]
MKLIRTVAELQAILVQKREKNKSIGFVPTMGALHQGHIELVKRAIAENDISVVSIFVNPTQFNDQNDLLKYPRTLDADCKLLQEIATDIVFSPDENEIYPEPDIRQFNFGLLETVMEGRFRPGHFNGVAQVVSRLFDIVKPDKAYFGEKDFQQLAIIRELVSRLKRNVQIVSCPIVREKDGLAMSSRNIRLNENQRKEAVLIFKTLSDSKTLRKEYTVQALKQWVTSQINAVSGLQVEYFDIVDGFTLQSIKEWSNTEYPVGCIAVYAGKVRLIDNIVYCTL